MGGGGEGGRGRNAEGLQLRGGAILTYLLERTRVVSLSAHERNYHFLYQLCAAANSGSVALPSASPALTAASVEKLSDPAVRASLGLGGGGAAKFRITAMGDCLALDGVDDAAGYRRTVHAMSLIGIDVGEQLDMLRVISAVLHLGNISFEAKESLFSPRKDGRGGGAGGGGGSERRAAHFSGEDMAEIDEDDDALSFASRLLKCDASSLQQALCVRTVRASSESVSVPNTCEQGAAARDALCKFLYSRVFDWLVERINASLLEGHQGGGDAGQLGLASCRAQPGTYVPEALRSRGGMHAQQATHAGKVITVAFADALPSWYAT